METLGISQSEMNMREVQRKTLFVKTMTLFKTKMVTLAPRTMMPIQSFVEALILNHSQLQENVAHVEVEAVATKKKLNMSGLGMLTFPTKKTRVMP
jgi:hypothetical protein